MAGKTLKTSVKSTVTKKTAKLATVKASPKSDKTTEKKTKSQPAIVKKAASAKTASKPKAATEVKSKAAAAKKSTAKTTSKPAAKPEKTSVAKNTAKKSAPKAVTAPKTEVKKTVKTKTSPKPEKTLAVKKTTKTSKSVQTQAAAKPVKKTNAVNTKPTKKSADSDAASKKSQVVNSTVKKQEEPVAEQELNSKPKAKRISKFMTKANAPIIAQLRQQLLQRRNEILSFYWGDLGSANVSSQASGDTADAATDSVHSEMRSQLAEKESQELTDINNALHKMETGEYGLCEECGMPIAIERLEAIPDAELCLKCQEELEEDGDYDNYSYYGYD